MGITSPGPCGYHLTVIHVRLSDSKKSLGGPWLWISMDEISTGSIPWDRGGGGGGWRAQFPKKFFSALWTSVWSKNKEGDRPPPRPIPLIRLWRFIFAVTSFSGRGRCHSYLGVPVCRVSPLDPLGKGYPKHWSCLWRQNWWQLNEVIWEINYCNPIYNSNRGRLHFLSIHLSPGLD